MAGAASVLRGEMRRHLMLNVGLVASCVVAGTVVTNERGLFVPIGAHSMSETAKAFAAMFTPSHLLPGLTNVQSIAPLEPFDVTADPRDLRHRLMDAFNNFSAPATDYNNDIAQYSDQTLTPSEYAGTPAAVPEVAGAPTAPGAEGSPSGPSTGGPGGGTPGGGPQSPPPLQIFNPTPPYSGPTTTPQGGGTPVDAPVPEPSMWLMLVAGFGAVGYMLRGARRRHRGTDVIA